MRTFISRWFFPLLIAVAGMFALQVDCALAGQDSTFMPTQELEDAKAAFKRLEQVRDEFKEEAYQQLYAEGEEVLALAQEYYEGRSPIQAEMGEATEKSNRITRELENLGQRIRDFNNTPGGTQEEANRLNDELRNLNEQLRLHNEYIMNDLNVRIEANNKKIIGRYVEFTQKVDKFIADANKSYRNIARLYQEKRKFAETLFASKEHFSARCAVVLSATLDLRPDPKWHEKSLADIDPNEIDPSFRGAQVLDRYYVQAQQLADRLARDWHQMERYDDWQTARAKVGGRQGVIFFRDADFRKGTMSFTGDHIDVWDGAATGSGYTFRSANEIWFWELER